MSIDIVKRLRQEIDGYTDGPIEAAETTMREAADEIERLQEAHETVSKIVDGMTLQFVERGKEI